MEGTKGNTKYFKVQYICVGAFACAACAAVYRLLDMVEGRAQRGTPNTFRCSHRVAGGPMGFNKNQHRHHHHQHHISGTFKRNVACGNDDDENVSRVIYMSGCRHLGVGGARAMERMMENYSLLLFLLTIQLHCTEDKGL